MLELPKVTLKVSPVEIVRKRRKTLVHFQAASIESGDKQWRRMHHARLRTA